MNSKDEFPVFDLDLVVSDVKIDKDGNFIPPEVVENEKGGDE